MLESKYLTDNVQNIQKLMVIPALTEAYGDSRLKKI
jgi:hypothetical protein